MNSSYLFKMFISPVLSSGLRMGEMIQSVELFQPAKKMNETYAISSGYYNVKYSGDKTLYDQIEKYLSSVQGQMAYLQSIGTSVFCVGMKQFIINFRDWQEQLLMAFRLIGLGTILTVVGLLISIVFAFYFLDAIMQLGLLGMMMPLMIAGWPFAITKNFASKGLEFLLNTFFVFFFTGFVVSVNVVLIDQSLTYSAEIKVEKSSSDSKAASQDAEKGLNGITKALQNQNIAELSQATNIGGTGFLLLIFSSLFGFKFIEQVNPIAGKLAGGVGISMAGQMGVRAMSTAKGMVNKATAPIQKAVGKKWNKAGGIVGIASGVVGGAVNAVGGVINKAGDVATASGLKRTGRNLGRVANAARWPGKVLKALQKEASDATMAARYGKK